MNEYKKQSQQSKITPKISAKGSTYKHKNTSDVRGVFRTHSNNYDGVFLRKLLTAKKLHYRYSAAF